MSDKTTDLLNKFLNQYPSVTSTDLQTFVLGMQARNEEVASLQAEIVSLNNILIAIRETLQTRDHSLCEFLNVRLAEHSEIFSSEGE